MGIDFRQELSVTPKLCTTALLLACRGFGAIGNPISACRAGGAPGLTHPQRLIFLQRVASRSWDGSVLP